MVSTHAAASRKSFIDAESSRGDDGRTILENAAELAQEKSMQDAKRREIEMVINDHNIETLV